MPTIREPILHPVPIEELRPTQITVGMREVEAKRQAWRAKEGDKGAEFLGRHMIPAILGPKGRYYVIGPPSSLPCAAGGGGEGRAGDRRRQPLTTRARLFLVRARLP